MSMLCEKRSHDHHVRKGTLGTKVIGNVKRGGTYDLNGLCERDARREWDMRDRKL